MSKLSDEQKAKIASTVPEAHGAREFVSNLLGVASFVGGIIVIGNSIFACTAPAILSPEILNSPVNVAGCIRASQDLLPTLYEWAKANGVSLVVTLTSFTGWTAIKLNFSKTARKKLASKE